MKRYYLDHNATSPLRPEARAAMEPWLGERGAGNPSSLHAEGRAARAVVDEARDRVAAVLGAKSHEIIFTGGGTESNNLAVCGLALGAASGPRRVAVSAVEHHAVLHAARWLQRWHGVEVTELPVDGEGRVLIPAAEAWTGAGGALLSVMSANNETGTLQPVEALGRMCRAAGVLCHTDAVQWAGRGSLRDLRSWVDALSLAGHKVGGPAGTGVLWVRAGVPVAPLDVGGAQENGRRAGTENVAGIAGLAAALEAAEREAAGVGARLEAVREDLWLALNAAVPGIRRNTPRTGTLANTLNVSVEGVDSEDLLIACDLEGLALSSGSACLVGSVEPSHVLRAMGVPDAVARGTVRFSLGAETGREDVPELVGRVARVVARLREGSR